MVAYAIGRACGPAVVRNRIRRRMRAIVREFDQTEHLPTGALMIGAQPATAELTFDQLRTELWTMLTRLSQDGSRR